MTTFTKKYDTTKFDRMIDNYRNHDAELNYLDELKQLAPTGKKVFLSLGIIAGAGVLATLGGLSQAPVASVVSGVGLVGMAYLGSKIVDVWKNKLSDDYIKLSHQQYSSYHEMHRIARKSGVKYKDMYNQMDDVPKTEKNFFLKAGDVMKYLPTLEDIPKIEKIEQNIKKLKPKM